MKSPAAAQQRPDVSVLVPVFNEEAHISAAAESILAQRFKGEIEFLFVDGCSQDGTLAILEALAEHDPRVRILANPRRQTAAGLNVGLGHARGDFCVRMDAHTRYRDDYVVKGVERLRRGDVEWVSGPAIPEGRGKWSRRVALALGSRLTTTGSRKWPSVLGALEQGAADGDRPGPPPDSSEHLVPPSSGVFGGVWARSTLEAHGGWDEGWPVNQDVELLARVGAAGGRVVQLTDLGGRYAPRDSVGGLARQYFRYGQYRAKTAGRHPQTLRRSHLVAAGLPWAPALALFGRGRIRRSAAAGLGAYGMSLLAGAYRSRGAGWRDAAALPLVFAVMQAGWGCGFLVGCVRFGLPLRGIGRAASARLGKLR